MVPYVRLTPTELDIVHLLAQKRRRECRGAGVIDRQVSKQDPWQLDIDGIVGEFVFARRMRLLPDLTTEPRSGGADFVTRNGQTFDVKATRYPNGRLIVPEAKLSKPCDFYALVIVDDFGGRFMGYMPAEYIARDEHRDDKGGRPFYAVPQHCLLPDPTLSERT